MTLAERLLAEAEALDSSAGFAEARGNDGDAEEDRRLAALLREAAAALEPTTVVARKIRSGLQVER